jgi:Tol biopolymer transport system component
VSRISFTLALVMAVLTVSPAASLAAPLPENRAYEQVSPVDKNGGDVGGSAFEGVFASALAQSAANGNSITYVSFSSFGDARSAELLTSYVSSRGPGGWSTHAISLPAASVPRFLEEPPFRFFSPDLSKSVVRWADPLTADAPPGYPNLYIRDAAGAFQLLTTVTPPNHPPSEYQMAFAGATPDLSHVVFTADDTLVPGGPPGFDSVYESTGSALRLVAVLPDGEPTDGALAGNGTNTNFSDVISRDGSRIFWTSAGPWQLYVREGGTRTVHLNASTRTISLGDGTPSLLEITPDGSRAYFTDLTPLTDAENDNGGLYEYDLDTESLRNLTLHPGGDPKVLGVLGVGEDGSDLYFVAEEELAPGAQAGAPNLYVSKGGAVEHVATLSAADENDWTGNYEARTSRVTPSGRYLVFLSSEPLTGYDNTDATSGEPDQEVFVYDELEDHLACVSCNPTNAPPIGGAGIPSGTSATYKPRVISDDGRRVFFNSKDALVAADNNRRQDVYEFVDGRPQLISSGADGDLSGLVDVSADARDVFFTTRARLVPQDRDSGADIYDARIGGGFPPEAELMPCAGEACRGPLSPPSVQAPPTTTLGGSGSGAGGKPGSGHRRCLRHRSNRGPHRSARKRCHRPAGDRRSLRGRSSAGLGKG